MKSSPAPASRELTASDISAQAKELEDLLIGAAKRQPTAVNRPQGSSTQPAPRTESIPRFDNPVLQPKVPKYDVRPESAPALDERAVVLVRAMVNAAKADGEISREEQQSILRQMDGATPETLKFLNEEFSKPLNVREFAWSVPLGLERDVYAISLIAIDVDSNREQTYLEELSHALRIPLDVRQQIQQQLGGRH